MAILVEQVSTSEARKLIDTLEGQFADVKATAIAPASLTKSMSAFANTDGGELLIGISENKQAKTRCWEGFRNQEEANGHIQAFEKFFPLGTDFQYEFIECASEFGLVLHVQINKTQEIKYASNGTAYLRRGAQNLPQDSPESMRRLEYSKGITSFERETLPEPLSLVGESEAVKAFIRDVVPAVEPEKWLRKQILIRNDKPTVAGILLFADEPQAVLPKRCGIKVYRYKTIEEHGLRDTLAFVPKTVEGCLYNQIREAVKLTTEIVEAIPKLGESDLEEIAYPPEALHEIVTNAVIHRDYSIADDVHIRIFDNRIEVQNPGRLPAHITVENILNERFARNGSIVRILNKYPDPPNKDVGEGLKTAFDAMHKLGLKQPSIQELDNNVLVVIRHEQLASPEKAILDFLQTHETIKNSEARQVTHITADHRIKAIFGRMVEKGMIEQVPDTRTANTKYRLPIK